MAISRDNLMGDDDCYICLLQKSTGGRMLKFKSTYLPKRQPPIEIAKTARYQYKSKLANGIMTCSFVRPYDVGIMNINGTMANWNLNQNKFHLIFAKGEVNNTTIVYHNANRDVTRIPINFTDPSLGLGPAENITTTTPVTSKGKITLPTISLISISVLLCLTV
uniref:DOMON domain-containing protein n=1 Tax=Ciona savignyi TaxID=51511 RepID=H2YVL8_CIOSA